MEADNIVNPSKIEEVLDGNDETVEVYDLTKAPKNHSNLQVALEVFGRKYYKCPLKNVNDNIKLYDKNLNEVSYDIRVVTVEPYEIKITTFFNENNKRILTNKMNSMLSVINPKYEHFVNFSTNSNIFITCETKAEPAHLKADEVIVKKMLATKDGKILKESVLEF